MAQCFYGLHDAAPVRAPGTEGRGSRNAAGEVPALPKYTATSVQRCLKAEAGAYQELAAAYAKPAAELQRVAAQHQAAFAEARPPAPGQALASLRPGRWHWLSTPTRPWLALGLQMKRHMS